MRASSMKIHLNTEVLLVRKEKKCDLFMSSFKLHFCLWEKRELWKYMQFVILVIHIKKELLFSCITWDMYFGIHCCIYFTRQMRLSLSVLHIYILKILLPFFLLPLPMRNVMYVSKMTEMFPQVKMKIWKQHYIHLLYLSFWERRETIEFLAKTRPPEINIVIDKIVMDSLPWKVVARAWWGAERHEI